MNKQIEKLLGQAYDEAVPETWTTLSSEQLGRVYDKFAELVVRECVAKTMEVGEQNDEPIKPIWVANCIAHRIFKHFGVKP